MARSSFRKELTAISGLAEFEGIATAEQVGALVGLATRTVGQIFRNNEAYVRSDDGMGGNGRGNKIYQLTTEGCYLIWRKRGIKIAESFPSGEDG